VNSNGDRRAQRARAQATYAINASGDCVGCFPEKEQKNA
jgi:hypothetical protein